MTKITKLEVYNNIVEVAKTLTANFNEAKGHLVIRRGEDILLDVDDIKDDDYWGSVKVDDVEYDFNIFTVEFDEWKLTIYGLERVGLYHQTDTSRYGEVALEVGS
jgi:hypothetical protein